MTVEGSQLPARRLGSYELLRPIAQGGMADVYFARRADQRGDRPLAIKLLQHRWARSPEARAMFLDEARLVALLHHQHIAQVHEVGIADGRHYQVMEYVHGVDLRGLLAAALRASLPGALPLPTAVAIACAAAAGLDHAHRRCGPDGRPLQLIHRDVSLSNIMVGHDGSVKLIDFGIATTTIASVQTSPGMVRGKASYMSPEQCLGDPLDQRCDVFALGVVLYELTTGARCFHGRTDFERMLAVVEGDYIAPESLVDDFPPALARVIRTALAHDPDGRFASAAAMYDALERIAVDQGWAVGPGAIQRTMHELFGDVPDPSALQRDDGLVTEPHALLGFSAPCEPTRPDGFAAGSQADATAPILGPLADSVVDPALERALDPALDPVDDLEERTRGRGPLRRPHARHRPWLAPSTCDVRRFPVAPGENCA